MCLALDSAGNLGRIPIHALRDIPVTVKLQTSMKDGKNPAHKRMPRLATGEARAVARYVAVLGCHVLIFTMICSLNLHVRRRQQWYTRLIGATANRQRSCVPGPPFSSTPGVLIRKLASASHTNFGGGDCFSSRDYWTNVEASGVNGVMIDHGAII